MAGNKSASAIGNLVSCQTAFPVQNAKFISCGQISAGVSNFVFLIDIIRHANVQFHEAHRQLPPRMTVHAALRRGRGNALGVALLEAGAGRPSDADGREKPFRSKCCLIRFTQFIKRPTLPVSAEQFANVAPRREFVGVQGGLSLDTDMTVCTWSLVRVGIFFRGSVVVGPMRLAFVVRARLKRGEKRYNNRIRLYHC